jgi:hypothetical protein
MIKKWIILQNFETVLSGRPTQLNLGQISEEQLKKFLVIISNSKPERGEKYYCGFDVFWGNEAFEVRPMRLDARLPVAEHWLPMPSMTPAKPDEVVIVLRPGVLNDIDCAVSDAHNCPICIQSGMCPSPFIRKYIGKVLFPNKYAKQK